MVGRALGSFGRKPKIPELPNIVPEDIQKATTAGNLAALPGLEALGSGVDQFNFDQLAKALSFWSPGALGKLQNTIAAQLSGEIEPEDTARAISNATAAGYGRGFGPTFGMNFGIGRRAVGRDLLFGVEQQKQRGLSNLMSLYQAGPRPFDVTSMFFSPQQRLAFAFQDRAAKFQRDLMAEQVAAAPDPADVALGEAFDNFFETWKNVGMGALGSIGGGMGGGGGGSPNMYRGSPQGHDWDPALAPYFQGYGSEGEAYFNLPVTRR